MKLDDILPEPPFGYRPTATLRWFVTADVVGGSQHILAQKWVTEFGTDWSDDAVWVGVKTEVLSG